MAVTAAWRNSEYLADLMARHRCPGLSICEIRDFAIACQVNAGVRSAVSADRVDCYTLFQAGSISKLVFALAVMRLVQDGVLNLDADVNNYLQSCQLTAGPGVATGATLRQILSHTAGVTVRGFPGYRLDEPIPDLLQVIEGSAPANTEPIYIATPSGRQFQYSGGGTTVAQQLVMDVTQRPFPDLMRSLVLGCVLKVMNI